MTKELVVNINSFQQWKDVLNVWFEKGYEWLAEDDEYREKYFINGSTQLALNINDMNDITCFKNNDYTGGNVVTYEEFMQKQTKTYYVTQEQLDFIEELKDRVFPLSVIFTESNRYKKINVNNTSSQYEKALLRYLGGDETIEFKFKEQLQRLCRIDDSGNRVYMKINGLGTPDWTMGEDYAFTAPLEEIKKWQTPAWEIEEVE